MPGSVKTAAILWIVFGGLGVLGQALSLVGGGFQARSLISLAISVAFVIAGIQTISGKAKDTLGNGIGSIVLGGLGLILILVAMAALGLHYVVLIGLLNSGGLVLAGILALVGRAGYKEWRGQTVM